MEQYVIKMREAKLRKELDDLKRKDDHWKLKKQQRHNPSPIIALVGYTNAGKTALTNLCSGSELDSQDKLFMTLNTA